MAAPDLSIIEGAGPLQPVDQIFDVPLDLIRFGERLRPIDPVWAKALGQIMLVEGQRHPVELCRLPGKSDFLLVSGGHRVDGRRLTEQPTVRAVFVSADALQRRAAEVSENLFRRDLDPLDRAAFVAELIHLQKVRAGVAADAKAQSVAAKARWAETLGDDADDASATMARAYGWTDDVGENIGLSRRAIYRDLELHRGLRPDVVAQLRGLPIARNAGQLRALAKLPEGEQRSAAALIFEGKAKGANDALDVLRQRVAPSAEAKRLSAFVGAFERMGSAEKRAALQTLAKLKLPAGVTLTFGGDAA